MSHALRWLPAVALLIALAAAPSGSGRAAAPDISPADTSAALVQATAPSRDLFELAQAYFGLTPDARVVHADPPEHRTGQVDTFWVSRPRPVEHFQVAAELRLVGRHAYWYVEPGHAISEAGLRRSADVFDTLIYPEVRRLVGTEAFPGIDDDPRITIFNGEVPGVAGYVSSADSYPRAINPYSNEREMLYLNLRALELGTPEYLATLAHEFTHLVHWNMNPSEDTWVKEGLADLVAWLVIPERGYSPATFFATPDLQLTSWSDGDGDAPPVSAHYQAATWFLRYFTDRFGESALESVLTRGSHGPVSFNAFLSRTGSGLTFPELYGDWVVANLVGQTPGTDVYPYASELGPRPRIRRLAEQETVTDTVAQFGTDYFELASPSTAALTFSGATTVPVVGAPPTASGTMWYAGRMDTAASTLTGQLDLWGPAPARLRYRVWYDVERDYDYVYLSASTDGGRTWTLLETPSMTRGNPTGNNLSVGYTGMSGGGARPEWMDESVDLTPFAGGPAWLRFSYVTDDAFLREGVVVDEVRLERGDAVGSEPLEAETWTTRGWARVSAELQQSWSVQVVVFGPDGLRVERVPVGPDGTGRWSGDGRPIERAVVAVSGTAPVTLQRGHFRLSVTS